jgi:hypothetical protein
MHIITVIVSIIFINQWTNYFFAEMQPMYYPIFWNTWSKLHTHFLFIFIVVVILKLGIFISKGNMDAFTDSWNTVFQMYLLNTINNIKTKSIFKFYWNSYLEPIWLRLIRKASCALDEIIEVY